MMATFAKCTTADKVSIQVNLDHVAYIRPHHSDRGFAGSEIVFSSGSPSSIIVEESQDQIAGTLSRNEV
jgi:hypothetical protein